MKNLCGSAGFVLACCLVLSGCAGGRYIAGNYQNGSWEGGGQGYRGTIRVRVRAGASLIQGIEILSHNEDPSIGGAAMEELLELVLEYQTTDVDGISGATESSAGFLAAVEDALNGARYNQGAEKKVSQD
jgi:fumarate reductase flavoprotein subunit